MSDTRSPRKSHNPFGVPTLPKVEITEEVEIPEQSEEPEPLPPPPVVEEPHLPVPELLPPAPKHENLVANRYEIMDKVGTGGMGNVYRVRHVELGKQFALKIIHAELSENPRAREMFYAEARMASSLEHRNIVNITDFGEDMRRGAFIVMEFLKGEGLADRLDDSRMLDIKSCCDIALQTADALAFTHSMGVIHGDIKPENIFLCRGAEDDRRRNLVKLLDFGLSRMAQPARKAAPDSLAGTPAYLAPERICGAQPDSRTDLYALGVLFYEMLTGQLPFDGTVGQILNAHISTPPTPPSFRVMDPLIDERMDDIILTCLAKDPAARYRDCRAFTDALQRLIDQLGIFRRRPPTPAELHPAPRPGDEACRAMMEGNPLPMFAVGKGGEITLANKSFALFVKDKAERVVGRRLMDTRMGTYCPGLDEDLKHVLKHNKVTSRELEFDMPNGNKSIVLIWLAPLAVGGLIVGAHGVVHWVRR